MNSRAVRRIDDVMLLRSAQFTEVRWPPAYWPAAQPKVEFIAVHQLAMCCSQDAGPMSHAVRPDAVKIFDNFYSLTVYVCPRLLTAVN